MASPTQYVRNGEHSIAFQLVGDGELDIVYVPTLLSHIEHLWEHRAVARFLERLASIGRLILWDRRGTGSSDPSPGPYSVEDEMDDLLAVLAAAESERAALFAQLQGGTVACLFAATHPQRVSALVLHSCFARTLWAADYAWAPLPEQRERMLVELTDRWGEGLRAGAVAPSWADDATSRAWLARLERSSASPLIMRRLNGLLGETDVRDALPIISQPTLVTRRRDDRYLDRRHALYLEQHIDGAKLVELPGTDANAFSGETEPLLDEIGRFLTGSPPPPEPSRILATLLFTDIVGSTELASRLGDHAWRKRLLSHNEIVRSSLERFGGREIKTLGDGFFAAFDAPVRAMRCALAIGDRARETGFELRAGIHTGECEIIDDDLAGITVHVAARIAATAGPSEVLVSSAVRKLSAGSDLSFSDHGHHQLKGISSAHHLWAVTAPAGLRTV